jgi:hypothetical protein
MTTLNQHDRASAVSTAVGADVVCIVIACTWLGFDASSSIGDRAGDVKKREGSRAVLTSVACIRGAASADFLPVA